MEKLEIETSVNKIATALNREQTNNPQRMNGPRADCSNLSTFGFALVVSIAEPDRDLRIAALKVISSLTAATIVIDQIEEYLADDRKWN